MRAFLLAGSIAAALAVSGCAPARPPLPPGYIPEAPVVLDADLQFGHDVFAKLSERYPIDNDDTHVGRVRQVVERLTKAIDARQDPWRVYVLKDDSFTNAAATKGNYVFVWSGMFQFVKSDSELAAILAHEIGHVLARHTAPTPGEEVNDMIASASGQVVGQIVSAQPGTIGLFGDLAGMLVEEAVKAFIVNPQAQAKELEADSLGIMIMAKAGYNPSDAVDFWERLEHVPEFSTGALPAFLSSHPSTKERAENLIRILPLAEEAFTEAETRLSSETLRPPRKNERRFRVSAQFADIFKSPSSKSTIRASLPQGFAVNASKHKPGWLKLEKPYAGFVRAEDLGLIDAP